MTKKLTKTEQKLLDRIDPNGAAGYGGRREFNAALKLEQKGLVKVTKSDGRYRYNRRDGSWGFGYHPQGRIDKI